MFVKKLWRIIFCVVTFLIQLKRSETNNGSNSEKVLIDTGPSEFDSKKKSEVIPVKDEPILLFSTLNGYLYRVDMKVGSIIWKQKHEPILKTYSISNMPVLFPDPLDGTLYRIDRKPDSGDIVSRLPETILDLVSKSPLYFSKLMCTGGKRDIWVNIEIESGRKLSSSGVDWNQDHCPKMNKQNGSSFYLGKSEYSLSLKDESNEIVWNLTYNTYSTHASIRNEDYNMKHVTSSQSGLVLTIDKETRKIIWTVELDSPVVGIYMLQKKTEAFLQVPLISMSMDTMQLILTETKRSGTIDFIFNQSGGTAFPIVSTLYVGQNQVGPYAICSATHEASQIRGQNGPYVIPLLTGPDNDKPLVVGHYIIPKNPKKQPVVGLRHRLTDQSKWRELTQEMPHFEPCEVKKSTPTIFVGGFIFLVGFVTYVFKSYRIRMGNNVAQNSSLSQKTEPLERPLPDGFTKVGKIFYNANHVIGHGCNGTMVFSGRFDDRDVAVKRIVRGSASAVWNKEIDLLKRLCKHTNVVSYFYSESNSDFHYIALELCDCSLENYVKCPDPDCVYGLSPVRVLKETMLGLQFLHSKKIIHRDLKPANVLLYRECEAPAQYRVVISDFGLGRQIPSDRSDITKATAMDGTEGWTAPEFSRDDIDKVSECVDIFSAGCLFYYVLTKGNHPFGEDRSARQFKIKHSEYNLSGISNIQNNTAYCLVKEMIEYKAEDRPSAFQIIYHPLFWTSQKRLQFIVEISDFVDKRCDDIKTLLPTLESNAKVVFHDNWINLISSDLMESLRKQRPYRGDQLRDLIRAIRNKKNHFFEMSPDMRNSLGGDLSGYLEYFTIRFPNLLPVLYRWAIENVSHESAFSEFFVSFTRSRSLVKSHTTPALSNRSHSQSSTPKQSNSSGSLVRKDFFSPRYKRYSLSEAVAEKPPPAPIPISMTDPLLVSLRPQYLPQLIRSELAPALSCPDLDNIKDNEDSSRHVTFNVEGGPVNLLGQTNSSPKKRRRRNKKSRTNKKSSDKTAADDCADEDVEA